MRAKHGKKNTGLREALYDWVAAAIFSLVTVAFVFSFVVRVVGVSGVSMVHTMENKDRLLMRSLFYTPKRNDIVVIYRNEEEEPLIKRVIALAGDTISIDTETQSVTVNGVKLDESAYVSSPMLWDIRWAPGQAVKVPEGEIFVLGDNRSHSKDSRDPGVGFVRADHVIGQAIFRVLPLERAGGL